MWKNRQCLAGSWLAENLFCVDWGSSFTEKKKQRKKTEIVLVVYRERTHAGDSTVQGQPPLRSAMEVASTKRKVCCEQ